MRKLLLPSVQIVSPVVKQFLSVLFILLLGWNSAVWGQAGISLNTMGATYTQNFNTLANTGATNPRSTFPLGWFMSETGTGLDTTYNTGTGSSGTGDTYSFGGAGSTERALGGLLSGSLVPTFGVRFVNNTGATINTLAIGYRGEQWRVGANGRVDRLDFQFSLNATSLTTGTWTDFDLLDFTAPTTTGAPAALIGNNSPNFTNVINSIPGLTITNGSTFWIRWNDLNASGADDGLSVDDFTLQPLSSNPEINVIGNLTPIIDGDNTPSSADHTDYGSVGCGATFDRTYTIANTGTLVLNITGVNITGVDAANFSVVTPPASTVAPGGGTTIFTVRYTPSGLAGAQNATIEILNDDPDEATFDFAISGTLTDAFAPVPDAGSLPTINAECSANPTAPTATDNCVGTVIGTPNVSLPITAQGSSTIIWTFDDGNGNTSTQNQNVIIDDVTPPTPSNLNLVPFTYNSGPGVIAFGMPDVTTFNVSGAPPVITPTTITSVCLDATFPTVEDLIILLFEPSASGTMFLTSFGAGVSGSNFIGTCFDQVSVTSPLSSSSPYTGTFDDDWAGPGISSFTGFNPNGTWQIQVLNFGGNTGTIDNLGITMMVPGGTQLNDINAVCSTVVNAEPATDNCGGAITTTASILGVPQTIPFTVNSIGTTVVDWTFDDGNGNTFIATQNINISACINQPPVAVCQSVTVSADGSCTGDALAEDFDGGSTDPDSDPLTFSVSPTGPYSIGTTPVTLTVDDGNGGTDICSTTINVVDDSAPLPNNLGLIPFTFSGSGSITPNNVDFVMINVSGLPNTLSAGMMTSACLDLTHPSVQDFNMSLIAPDFSSINLTQTGSGVTGANFINTCFDIISSTSLASSSAPYTGAFNDGWLSPSGFSTFNGIDPNGTWFISNTNTGGNAGTINDVTLTFMAPGGTNLTDINAVCSATITGEAATDNCNGTIDGTASILGVPQTLPFTITTQGTTVITWTFTDVAGNSATYFQNVIIDDVTAPVADVTPLADVTAECSVASLTAPTATDNCAGTITGTTATTFPITAQGTTVVTWIYNDGNGNSSTQDQNVIIDDVTAPVADVTPLADVTAECSVASLTAPTATDNCAGTITGTTLTTFPITAQGTTLVTWIYNDGNGNSSTQDQNVIIDDVTNPVLTCSSITVNPSSGSPVTVLPGMVTTGASDNCGVLDTTVTPNVFDCSMDGNVIPIVVELFDVNGNSITCNTTVTVTGVGCTSNNPPVAICQSLNVPANGSCVYPALASEFNNGSTDPDSDPLTFSISPSGPFGLGTTNVTLTVDDGNGGSSTCTTTITVTDNTAPVPNNIGLVPFTYNSGPGVIAFGSPDVTTFNISGAPAVITPSTISSVCIDATFPTVEDLLILLIEPSSSGIMIPTSFGAGVFGSNFTGTCFDQVSATSPVSSISPYTGTFDDDWAGSGISGFNGFNPNGTWQIQIFNFGGNTGTLDNLAITMMVPGGSNLADVDSSCQATIIGETATDNCNGIINGTASIGGVPQTLPLVITTEGTTVITWMFNDGNGNSTTALQNVNISDDVTAPAPNALSLADVTAECSVASLTAPTATDNCAGTITGTTVTTFPITAQGTTVVTWIYNDGNGNSSTQDQNVIIDDVTAPVADVTPLADVTAECSVASLTAPTATDNCAGTITGTTVTTFPITAQGTTVVTWIYNDGNGNSSTQDQNVIIDDITAPVITCDSIAVHPTFGTPVTVLPGMVTLTASDNCGILDTTVTPNVFDCSMDGMIIPIVVELTDIGGNTTQCSTDVHVQGVSCLNAPPVAICQNITVNADAGCEGTAVATDFDNGSFDPNGDPITFSVSPVGPYPLGITNVTLTVDDGIAGSSTCTATINVVDVTDPTITCPADLVLNTEPGTCSIDSVNLGLPVAADNCTIVVVTNDAPAVFNTGITTVTWTATDGSGNSSTCTQLVTVNDIELPVALCNPITVYLDGTGNASITANDIDAGSTDNCGIDTITVSPNTFTCINVGANSVTLTVTDINTNSSTCVTTVTVLDTIAPSITCPSDVSVGTDAGLCTASGVVLGTPVVGDNCAGTTFTNNAPLIFSTGNTTVVWTATDASGNSSTCNQIVTVTDTEDPVANCQNVIAYLDATGNVIVTPAQVDNGSTDNCGITTMTLTPNTFDCSDLGMNSVVLTVFDAAGNSSTCNATVDVQDTLDPIVTAPADVIVNADLGVCYASGVVTGNPTITDNCNIQFVLNDGLGLYPVGTTVVTWTVIDFSGNSTVVTQNITVVDNQAPVVACQNITVNLDGTGNATITASMVDNGSTDNCGIASMSIDVSTFNCSNVGANTVTLTVVDVNGSSSTCTSIVTIVDNQAPTITAPSDVTVNADLGSCFASGVVLGSATTADNCAGVTVTNNAPTNFPVGVTTVIWTATDVNGNSSTDTQIVTVIDNQNPTFSGTPANITENNIFGSCFATATWAPPVASDNCSVISVSSNFASGSVFPVGTTTVIYTATDASGNTGTTSFTVTVIDNQAPAILGTPASIIANADPGLCSAVVGWTSPNAFDNCSGVTLTSNFAPGSTFPVGVTTVIYTATDASGNSTTSTFTVTVNDNQAPLATVTSPLTLNVLPGQCFVPSGSLPLPATSDNCGILSVTNNASSPLPVGTHTIVWTVTDVNGNVTTVNQTVIVIDNQNPTITAPTNVTAVVNAPNCVATGVSLGVPVFGDNCGVASVSNNALSAYPVGVTTITWTVVDIHGNTSTATQTVTVTGPPITVGVTATPSGAICLGTSVSLSGTGASTYSWSGGIFNGVPFTPSATTTYTVTATGAFGCTATATHTVVVNPLPVVSYTVSPNDSVCPNSTVTLSGTGADTYVWTGGITDATPFIIPSTTTYTVTGTDVNGCTATATATIWTSSGTLTYNAFPNDTVCEGTEITLTGTGGSGYTWIGGGVVDGVPFTPTASFTTILSGTDAFGCAGNISVDIVVNYNPVVNLGPDTVVGVGFYELDAGNIGSSYIWNSNGMLNTQSIFVNNNGTYYVEVTDQNGCFGSDTVNVTFSLAGLDDLDGIDLTLYPNPSNGIFTLSLSDMPRGKVLLRLVDELGQVIYANELQAQTQTYDFSYLRAATYYVQLITNNGSVTKPIIITHKY